MGALELLVAACEREYLCDDEPDDSDVSIPPCGITMGMIRAARREVDLQDRDRLVGNLMDVWRSSCGEAAQVLEHDHTELVQALNDLYSWGRR